MIIVAYRVFLCVLFAIISLAPFPVRAENDHRLNIEIDKEATIVPVSPKRAMMSMIRHPDGPIFLNTQTEGVLYKSVDNGGTWKTVTVNLPTVAEKQAQHGLGVGRDGRLWLMHQTIGQQKDLFVSFSDDGGLSWATTPIDFAQLAPRAPQHPFYRCSNYFNTFFQQPDGTMNLGVGMRYEDWKDYQQEDPSRPGFHETLIRSSDGGKTWGNPTEVHPHVAETHYAVDPRNMDHIIAMTRKQRMTLRGETKESLTKDLGQSPPILSCHMTPILFYSARVRGSQRIYQDVN